MTDDATTLLQSGAADGPAPALTALLPGADQAVWSPDSKDAVLFSSSTTEIQQVSLVDAGWTASDVVSISELPPGAALVAAMSSCRCAVFTSVDSVARHFIRVGLDGVLLPLADFDSSAIAALDLDDQLYVASTSQVQRMHLSDPVPVPELVVQDSTLTQPAAILASQSDNVLLVAVQDGRVFLYDLQFKTALGVVSQAVNAATLRRLSSLGRYYQLNDPKLPTDALYVLALGQINRVFFVPALEP
jgi:hypothetical protein